MVVIIDNSNASIVLSKCKVIPSGTVILISYIANILSEVFLKEEHLLVHI